MLEIEGPEGLLKKEIILNLIYQYVTKTIAPKPRGTTTTCKLTRVTQSLGIILLATGSSQLLLAFKQLSHG